MPINVQKGINFCKISPNSGFNVMHKIVRNRGHTYAGWNYIFSFMKRSQRKRHPRIRYFYVKEYNKIWAFFAASIQLRPQMFLNIHFATFRVRAKPILVPKSYTKFPAIKWLEVETKVKANTPITLEIISLRKKQQIYVCYSSLQMEAILLFFSPCFPSRCLIR